LSRVDILNSTIDSVKVTYGDACDNVIQCQNHWKVGFILFGSPDISAVLVTGVGAGRPGFSSLQDMSLVFGTMSRQALETRSAFYAVDIGALLSGVKRPGREAERSAPSRTKVKNTVSPPPVRQHGVLVAPCYNY
jgi:hypothetical protein